MKLEISLAKFLSLYAHLGGACLETLTHDDVKALFPSLKRCPFAYIDHDDTLLRNGEVLLVNDGKKTIAYYAPNIDLPIEEVMEVKCDAKKKKEKTDACPNYVDMSVYELKCLLERKFNSLKVRRRAKKELNSRGYCLQKKYNRSKENIEDNKEDYYEGD